MLRRILVLPARFVAIEPKSRFRLVQDQLRVRIDGAAGVINEAVGMVRVDMGEKDGSDLFRRDAQGAEILREFAERRPHGVAGAGIDQRPFSLKLEQERVDRDVHAIAGLLARKALALGPVHAENDVERSRQHAVA